MSSEVATEEEKRAVADMARTRGDGLEQRRGTIIVLSPSKQAQNWPPPSSLFCKPAFLPSLTLGLEVMWCWGTGGQRERNGPWGNTPKCPRRWSLKITYTLLICKKWQDFDKEKTVAYFWLNDSYSPLTFHPHTHHTWSPPEGQTSNSFSWILWPPLCSQGKFFWPPFSIG